MNPLDQFTPGIQELVREYFMYSDPETLADVSAIVRELEGDVLLIRARFEEMAEDTVGKFQTSIVFKTQCPA